MFCSYLFDILLVVERKFSDKENLVIICNGSCSYWTIEVRSAVYGVFIKEKGRYIIPYKISSKAKECLSSSALSVVKENCNGKSKCSFTIQKDKFLPKSFTCTNETSLVVHYTCKTATLGKFFLYCMKYKKIVQIRKGKIIETKKTRCGRSFLFSMLNICRTRFVFYAICYKWESKKVLKTTLSWHEQKTICKGRQKTFCLQCK